MKIQEVINKVLQKLEKDATNNNLSNDKPRLILALNEAQNKFAEWGIEKKNEDDSRLIQRLLKEKSLSTKSGKLFNNSWMYPLPEDFFEHVNVSGNAKKDKCKVKLDLWEIKGQNVNEVLADEDNKPSFYYAEAPYIISDSSLKVFVDDFTLENLHLLYYRYPLKMNIEGYVKDGKPSSNIDPEWGDREMDRIIDIAVKDLATNSGDYQKAQIDNQKILSKY